MREPGKAKGVSVVEDGRCLIQRLRVDYLAQGAVRPGERGILCVGVPGKSGLPPLVAVCDETDRYGGASATNAMELVLSFLRKAWAEKVEIVTANIVECDSMGAWDLVRPKWTTYGDASAQSIDVTWSPIRWPGQEPRSEGALRWAFGAQADRMLGELAKTGFRAPTKETTRR